MSNTSYGYGTPGEQASPSDHSIQGEQGSPYDITPHSENTSPSYQPDKYQHPCPYPECDRMFACPHNVTQHCREKHGEGGRKHCTLCPASFARAWPLYRHVEKVHGMDIHPGRGRGTKSGRKTIGGQGPKLVQPQPTREWKIRILSDVPVFSDFDADVGAAQTFDRPAFFYDFGADVGAEQTFDRLAFFYDFGAESFDETALEPTMDNDITDANFTYQQITCTLCLETFETREDFLGHAHLAHNLAYSELCDCMVCTAHKLSGVPFEEVQVVPKTSETPHAQAGADETDDQNLLVDTAMNMHESSTFQDSPLSPLSIGQLPEGDLETTAGSEPPEVDSISDWFDLDGASAGYDQLDFQHLEEGWQRWLREAESAFDGLEAATAEDDEVMQQY